jgi:hypothetical protein
MKPNKLMTLLTDLRHEDCFVGTLKGVLLRRQPQARIVDLSHGVPPGDIRAGAFALAAACRYFPRGTIHVAIVDPGVGGARPAIMVGTDEFFFVGPDNGLLSLALRRGKVRRIHRLGNPRYFPDAVSRTFHGRDIFAPVAAHLSRGVPGHRFGSEQRGFQQLPWPELYQHGGAIHGEIVYVDRFGNAISNLGNELAPRGGWEVRVQGGRLCPGGGCYQSVPPGRPVAVPGSTGLIEIAINGGDAARTLGLRIGSRVTFAIRSHRSEAVLHFALYTVDFAVTRSEAQFKMQNAKCRMQNAECKMQNAKCKVESEGFELVDLRAHGLAWHPRAGTCPAQNRVIPARG